MADLPDLDTTPIGYLVYWNAMNHGVGSIDPEDVLSDGNINSYTLYDNGVQIDDYTSPNGDSITARVKSDGWFVVWRDHSESFGTNQSSPPRGHWDIWNDWSYADGGSLNIDQNTLERPLNSLASQLGNFGSITYNTSDVGLYNYTFTDATTLTAMGYHSSNKGEQSHDLSYTSGVELKSAVIAGSAKGDTLADTYVRFEGLAVAEDLSNDVYRYGSIDLIAEGVIPNDSTTYSMTTNSGGYSSYNAKGAVNFLWA